MENGSEAYSSRRRRLRLLCVTAICTALFVVVTLCLQTPIFENYYLCLGYMVMAICLYSFGTVSGTVVGVLGVVFYCLLISGLRGMPGWAVGNLAIGVILGLTFRLTKKMKKKWLRVPVNVIAVAASTALGILILKSLTECILYAQPMIIRIGKNVFAFAADVFVLEFSLPLCMSLDKPIRKALKLQ
ncbi:MAG: ECF transporter S component [Clostridia bacterium]|nr:ECF transporter S component [Clostridia bacterium]